MFFLCPILLESEIGQGHVLITSPRGNRRGTGPGLLLQEGTDPDTPGPGAIPGPGVLPTRRAIAEGGRTLAARCPTVGVTRAPG